MPVQLLSRSWISWRFQQVESAENSFRRDWFSFGWVFLFIGVFFGWSRLSFPRRFHRPLLMFGDDSLISLSEWTRGPSFQSSYFSQNCSLIPLFHGLHLHSRVKMRDSSPIFPQVWQSAFCRWASLCFAQGVLKSRSLMLQESMDSINLLITGSVFRNEPSQSFSWAKRSQRLPCWIIIAGQT